MRFVLLIGKVSDALEDDIATLMACGGGTGEYILQSSMRIIGLRSTVLFVRSEGYKQNWYGLLIAI